MPRIRPAGDADQPAIRAIFNDAVANTTAVYDETLRTPEAQAQWFAAKLSQNLPVLVAEADGQVAGYASFGPFRPFPGFRDTVENALYVAPEHRGKGVGKALLAALIAEAQARRLHVMVAAVDGGNAASIRLHEGLGFVEVGRMPETGRKFGRWLDLVLLQKML